MLFTRNVRVYYFISVTPKRTKARAGVSDPVLADICTIVFVDSLQGRRLRQPG